MTKLTQLIALFCVVLVQSVSAQVTIPDANLRAKLKQNYPYCFGVNDVLDTICAATADTAYYKMLDISSSQIANLEGIKYFKNLHSLHCQNNLITNLPELPSKIRFLDLSYNQLTSIANNLPDSLIWLMANHNQITNAGLPVFSRVVELVGLDYNLLTGFPVFADSIPAIGTISVAHNQISNIPGPFHYWLWALDIGNNPISTIPDIYVSDGLFCDSTNISCLPFLNPLLERLQTEGSNITCIPNKPANLVTNLPVCNATNNPNDCRAFPTVTGYVFHDNNNNGVKDAGEMPRVGIFVAVYSQDLSNNYGYAYTDNNGAYQISMNLLLDTLNNMNFFVEANMPSYFTTPVAMQAFELENSGSYSQHFERNFPLQTTQTVKDFQVHLTNLNAFARPGFGLNLHLGYQNKGTVPANAVIKFAKADLYDVASSSIAHTLSGDTLVWTIPNVQAGQLGYIQIQGTLSASAPLGSIQNFYAAVNQNDATDNMIADNSSLLQMEVRGSYDPNDKQGPATITPTQVANGKFIDYTIRFQNTGTDTAFNVVVTDTLANNLQANTLEIVSASHNMMTELKGNIIYFKSLSGNYILF
jgi:uncharacterized repeat protein (TIGR01451 family)